MTPPKQQLPRRVLIANRGEIACRVIRTLRDMEIQSVAAWSDADAGALHVRLADHAVHVGPPAAALSYLSIERMVGAALESGCDAVMPGYGFLSENAAFARACQERGLCFIGPSAHALEVMGSKIRSRQVAEQVGAPLIPGGPADNETLALESAERIGYPVLLKASAGGGGKGMRVLENPDELRHALEPARREAERAFGDGQLYLERALIRARHVEIQVLGDRHGNLLHLFERDCSIQRRHQKVIEETPCPVLPDDTLERMGEVALLLARAVDYDSAGTVEFMLDATGQFYFLEMNTRLQVEHPITELVTGVDLVRQMVLAASGLPLELDRNRLVRRGVALECRVCAEDPAAGYLPRTGRIELYREPTGPFIRVDGGIVQGSTVDSHYDPLLAKVCSWGETREVALRRMRRALQEFRIGGVATNLELLRAILDTPSFAAGDYDTQWLRHHNELTQRTPSAPLLAALAGVAFTGREREAERYHPATRTPWSRHGEP